MKKQFEQTFTTAMQAVPAQIAITGDCVQPALSVLDAVDSDLTAFVVVGKDGGKAVVAVPGMDIAALIKVVASPMESAITNIPETAGKFFVNRAIPRAVPVTQQEVKTTKEGGFSYWVVRTILGFGFGNRFSVVEVLLPSEKRQEAKGFLYRVQRYKNNVATGVKPDGPAAVFGSQLAAVAFAYGQDADGGELYGAAKSAKSALFDFVGKAKAALYASSAPARRTRFNESLAVIGDVVDVSKLDFVTEVTESEPEPAPAKVRKAKARKPVEAISAE